MRVQEECHREQVKDAVSWMQSGEKQLGDEGCVAAGGRRMSHCGGGSAARAMEVLRCHVVQGPLVGGRGLIRVATLFIVRRCAGKLWGALQGIARLLANQKEASYSKGGISCVLLVTEVASMGMKGIVV